MIVNQKFFSERVFHCIDYSDAVDDMSPEIDSSKFDRAGVAYIERHLQSNQERFDRQVSALTRFVALKGKRVVDVGRGGGPFLAKARALGADVVGVELSDRRVHYAVTKHDLPIVKRPIEDNYWAADAGSFDVVTLWDVIEHANFPCATLRSARRLLKPGRFYCWTHREEAHFTILLARSAAVCPAAGWSCFWMACTRPVTSATNRSFRPRKYGNLCCPAGASSSFCIATISRKWSDQPGWPASSSRSGKW